MNNIAEKCQDSSQAVIALSRGHIYSEVDIIGAPTVRLSRLAQLPRPKLGDVGGTEAGKDPVWGSPKSEHETASVKPVQLHEASQEGLRRHNITCRAGTSINTHTIINMSTTTTVTRSELSNILSDYQIHLTGDNSTAENATSEAATVENPTNWPVNHRRVPDYRPIDRNRGFEERPNGSNGFEQGFLVIMFTGVVTNAVRGIMDIRKDEMLMVKPDYRENLGCYRRPILSTLVQVCNWRGMVIL